MKFDIMEKKGFTLIGYELEDAAIQPEICSLAWIKLCSKIRDIENITEPEIIYGAWYQEKGKEEAYMAGVEVKGVGDVPSELKTIYIRDAIYATIKIRGRVDFKNNIGELETWILNNKNIEFRTPRGVTLEIYDTSQEVNDEFKTILGIPIVNYPRRP